MSESILKKVHQIRMLALSVVKTGEIPGYGSRKAIKFASYADVWSALQPALKEVGLSVGFCSSQLQALAEAEMVRMTMVISDGLSECTNPFEMIVPERILNASGSSVTNSSQRVANACTFLKRTALIHFFGISTGDEDEVERMNPRGDQTNIPGLIIPNEATTWQSLMDGMWSDVMSPLHDGKLATHASQGDLHMKKLWMEYPEHPGMLAWVGDYINGTLETAGLSWADLEHHEPSLPGSLTACNPKQMQHAARALKAIVSERGAA